MLKAQGLVHQSGNNVSGEFGCGKVAEILLNALGLAHQSE